VDPTYYASRFLGFITNSIETAEGTVPQVQPTQEESDELRDTISSPDAPPPRTSYLIQPTVQEEHPVQKEDDHQV
jgi:hypothetical protein